MSRIILLLFLLAAPVVSFAQIQIGDIEVGSLSELFNKENKALWSETGTFNKSDSNIWIASLPSMIMDTGTKKSIILGIKKDLNQDSVRTVLINQFNKQFGEFEETKDTPIDDIGSLEWQIKKDDHTYSFSLSKDISIKGLVIVQI